MFKGVLKKMISEVDNPIRYFLDLENDFIEMNQCIDHQISKHYRNDFSMGYDDDSSIYRQLYN